MIPWEESASANDFYDGYSGSFNVLRSLIHVKSTLISVLPPVQFLELASNSLFSGSGTTTTCLGELLLKSAARRKQKYRIDHGHIERREISRRAPSHLFGRDSRPKLQCKLRDCTETPFTFDIRAAFLGQ